jgi:acyl dehydratase
MRYFEDFAEGEIIDLGNYIASADEIIEFAEEFDPAPFHVSESGGRNSMFGGLVASGWHTCAIGMRMMCDSFLLDSAGQGAPGIEFIKWLNPVRPGTRVSGRAIVQSRRQSNSRPDIGLVHFRFEYWNEKDEPLMALENWIMFTRKTPAAAGGGAT